MSTAGGTPATAPKAARKLPFKRTVKRKSVDVADPGPAPKKKDDDDDDVLGLFKRSGDFFQEQQRLSAANPDKKPPKPSPRDDDDEATYSTQAEAQLVLESSQSRPHSSAEKQHGHAGRNESKRVCIELSGDESNEGRYPQGSRAVRRDSSALQYPSTSRQRSPPKARASPRTRSAARNAAPQAILLDDSADDDDAMGAAFSSPRRDLRGGKRSLRAEMAGEEDRANSGSVGSDSEPEAAAQPSSHDDGLDDMTRRFVLEAKERIKREKAARLAREANPGASAAEADPPATIIIESHIPNTHHLTTLVKLSQQMQLVKSSWVLHNIRKKAPWSPEALDATFFTWKGRKIYPHTTLASLNIKPDAKGQLTPKWEANKAGFVGWDKVHFEAWTQDLFEEAEREKERERRRQLGELDDDDDVGGAAAAALGPAGPASPGAESEADRPETKVRLICKSRNHGNQSMTVPSHVALSAVATAFRRMKKIPTDKNIEIHFDGEALDLSSTLEQAGIEDEDCVEVHIS